MLLVESGENCVFRVLYGLLRRRDCHNRDGQPAKLKRAGFNYLLAPARGSVR